MKAFQYVNGSHRRVVHEDEILPSLNGPDGANVQKVLALELKESVTFPSGATWTRVEDDAPKLHTIVCNRRTTTPCKYCNAPHTKLCDYPVERNGKAGTCDIPMCDRCAQRGGANIDYCRPHAKMMRTGGAAAR
ncbi:MAG TPA: hypothetical protein VF761_17150 [Gemmatimonadaceae bacterium]